VFGELAPDEIAAIDEGLALFLGLAARASITFRLARQQGRRLRMPVCCYSGKVAAGRPPGPSARNLPASAARSRSRCDPQDVCRPLSSVRITRKRS
jgi:hypothetical protein